MRRAIVLVLFLGAGCGSGSAGSSEHPVTVTRVVEVTPAVCMQALEGMRQVGVLTTTSFRLVMNNHLSAGLVKIDKSNRLLDRTTDEYTACLSKGG